MSHTFQVLKYRLCFEILVQRTQTGGSLGAEREEYGLLGCNAAYFDKLHGITKQKVITISVLEDSDIIKKSFTISTLPQYYEAVVKERELGFSCSTIHAI